MFSSSAETTLGLCSLHGLTQRGGRHPGTHLFGVVHVDAAAVLVGADGAFEGLANHAARELDAPARKDERAGERDDDGRDGWEHVG